MVELLSGQEVSLSEKKIIALIDEAKKFLSSPQGNKFLREFDSLEAFAHGQFPYIDDDKTYKADQYLTKGDRFSITDFGPAIFIPEMGRLISHPLSIEDLWYYFAHKDLLHSKKWQGLEKQVMQSVSNFESLYRAQEISPVTGYVGLAKENLNLRFFNKMWQNEVGEANAMKLLSHGWVPIRWSVKGYILTTDDQKHYFDKPLGWHTLDEWFQWIKLFQQMGTYKNRLWEIDFFHISVPHHYEYCL